MRKRVLLVMAPSSSNRKEKAKTSEGQKKKELVGQITKVYLSSSKRSLGQTSSPSSLPPRNRTADKLSKRSVAQASSRLLPPAPPPLPKRTASLSESQGSSQLPPPPPPKRTTARLSERSVGHKSSQLPLPPPPPKRTADRLSERSVGQKSSQLPPPPPPKRTADKSKKSFEVGHIWALYNESDRAPCLYARIDNIFDSGGMVEVTQLEPHPITAVEMKWVEKDLHMACGTFKVSQSTCIKDKTLFSHRVICDEEKPAGKLFYTVYPRKGEVWAIFEQLNIDGYTRSYQRGKTKNIKYKLVEADASVAPLVRVSGHENVFRREMHYRDFGLFKKCTRDDLLRFSHRIPSLREHDESIKIKSSHNGI